MELSVYLRILRRWLWLILLAAVISGSVSFATVRAQPARYQASTLIQIGAYLGLSNPNSDMIANSAALGQTYIALMKTTPILDAVIKKLQLTMTTDALSDLFQTRIVAGTSLLEIVVIYTDRVIAADIANELANQLIASSPTEISKDQLDQINVLQNEIKAAQSLLEKDRNELKVIETSINSVSDQDRAILTERKTELNTEINTAQNNLALLSNTLAGLQQRGNINSIRVVEPSRIPQNPINPSPLNSTLLAASIGAMLAATAAFLIEYLNDSLRAPSEVAPLLNVPLLGSIPVFGSKRSRANKLITWTQPRSTISEAYRALRVNILFRENNGESLPDSQVYFVTSAGPSEGKSVTIANLAITFAITGMRVLIIDADLRRPTVHSLFELPNDKGLSDIWNEPEGTKARTTITTSSAPISGNTTTETITRNVRYYLSQIIQKTEIPNLDIITSGPVPNNPAELLDSPQTRELVNQINDSHNYDVVFFDSPPTLVVSDSSIISNAAKAKAIVVFESGRTHRGAALRTIQTLTTLSIPVVGVILNRLKAHERDAEYGYYYYYGYSRYGENNPVNPMLPSFTQPRRTIDRSLERPNERVNGKSADQIPLDGNPKNH